ncbi:MAG: PD40 domain-containing protein [Anaerolineales bacterium]|nr:PD40 domain-containing protein [Anaerolineales bacterium]
MSDEPLPPELEPQLRTTLAAPAPDPAFVQALRGQLASRAAEMKRPARRRLVWQWALTAALAAAAGLYLIGPGQVVTAMRRWLGYLPGVGLVDTQVPLRELTEPSTLTRDGITVSVLQAVLDSEKTVLGLRVDGIPPAAFPRSEGAPACFESPRLRLPDGGVLNITGGGGQGWGAGYEHRLTYAAVPAGVETAVLEIPCLQDTAPGAAPENWALPLHFRPATMLPTPVIDLAVATATAAATATPSAVNTPALTTATAVPLPAFGVQLTLEQAIPVSDGYVLVGRTAWTDPRLTDLSPQITAAQDAGGHVIPIEPAYLGDLGIDNPAPNQWGYKLYGQIFAGPVTLRADRVGVTLRDPVRLTFDPGTAPAFGQTWAVSQTVDVLGYTVEIQTARFIRQGDLHGFEFTLRTDPALNGLDFGVALGAGGGSTSDGAGRIMAYALRDGVIAGPLTLSASTARVAGTWSVTWTPPAKTQTGVEPTPVPQACLTLEKLQQALAQPGPLPAEAAGRLIAYGRIVEDGQPPSPENYGVFIFDLQSNAKKMLGTGVWPALSPDGQRAAYAGTDGLHVVDLAGGADTMIPNTRPNDYSPRWSPDSTRLAFVRVDDLNLYVIGADGSGLRRLTTDPAYEQLLGWSHDGAHLYFTQPGAEGQRLRILDLASGAITESAWRLGGKGISAALSPDDRQLAFIEPVPGQMGAGLYLAEAGGVERRLLAQLSHWGVSSPVWSPDGRWLLVSVTNTDLFSSRSAPALINLATCQPYALAGIEGEVFGWAP